MDARILLRHFAHRSTNVFACAAVAIHHRTLHARACAMSVAIAVLAITGCAETPARSDAVIPPATATPISPSVEPPPPNVNLSGFPLPYRQGYADGCASAGGRERKDASRFASDGNYRTGWQDGVALCKKK
jgi:hypothetical protein